MKLKKSKYKNLIIRSLMFSVKNPIFRHLNEISKISEYKDKELKKYQEEKLKDLLKYAYENVPYYRKVLGRCSVVDSDLNVRLENFEKIPILTKDIIREEFDNLKSKKLDEMKWAFNTSGGSTGEPVKFIQDRNYTNWNIANKLFYKSMGGQKIGDKEIRLWGSERDLLKGRDSFPLRVQNFFFNRTDLNSFKMSEKDMEGFVKVWNEKEPKWIESYVQSIYEFGKYVKENGIKIYKPKGILTSAGTLYPEMRELIEEVFGCEVYNRYGSREVGDIACGKDKLLISHWNQYIEILDDKLNKQKTNKIGDIYITNLNNYSMPLIRYQIGDIGIRGNKYKYLNKVVGRTTSIIRTKTRAMDGAAITTSIYYISSLKNYQFIQKTLNKFELKVVLLDRDRWRKVDREKVVSKIKKLLGDDINLKVIEQNYIASNKNGKYQYVISELK